MYYAKYFFITSIIGFIIESVVCGNFKGNSGILYGPWTVVYGFGSVLILLINKIVSKNIKNKVLKIISLFIISTISLTILELFGGILIEKIFGIVFWDYSDCKYRKIYMFRNVIVVGNSFNSFYIFIKTINR